MTNKKPDSLIFDVDGVLLNVEKSFPEVIRLCVLKGWEKFCGGIVDDKGYTAEHERIFKRHDGFNDDYDVAWTLLSLSAHQKSKKLSESFPSPQKLQEELKTFYGSVQEWVLSRYGNLVSRKKVREYCNDLYCGTKDRVGLHTLEIPMVNCHWSALPLPVAIYTGRNLSEFELAKKSLGWEDFSMELVIHADTGITKPSPKGLSVLCEKMDSVNPLFFGDTASDMKAQEAFGMGRFVAIGEHLLEAELIFNDTETALKTLLNNF